MLPKHVVSHLLTVQAGRIMVRYVETVHRRRTLWAQCLTPGLMRTELLPIQARIARVTPRVSGIPLAHGLDRPGNELLQHVDVNFT